MRDEIGELRAEMIKLRDEVQELRRFQSWIMGIAAGAGAIIGLLASAVRKKLGL